MVGEDTDHGERIVMIELYHKNDKEIEDKQRIKKHFK